MARAAKATRRPSFTAPAITPTRAQQGDLQRIYMQVVREWARLVVERILPAYERELAAPGRLSDARPIIDADQLGGELESAAAALTRLVLGLDASLEDWEVRVEEWHRGRFGQLFTPVGVKLDTVLGRGDVKATLQSTLGENTALIRSLSDQLRNGISGHVFRGLTERRTAADVARDIKRETAMATRRAELIAADQLQKLTGRLDQERQEQVGITKFEWAHSHKANPRPEHVARNGKIYAWDSDVAKTDPPGRAIRCGCRARAVVELEGDDEAT